MANEVITPDVVDSREVVTDSVKERTIVKSVKPSESVLNRSLNKVASNIKNEINRALRRTRKTTSLNTHNLVKSMKNNIDNTNDIEVTLVPQEVTTPASSDVTLEVDKSK